MITANIFQTIIGTNVLILTLLIVVIKIIEHKKK